MSNEFFPPDTNPQYSGLLKVSYTGTNKHEGEEIGLFDTVLSSTDYQAIFENRGID